MPTIHLLHLFMRQHNCSYLKATTISFMFFVMSLSFEVEKCYKIGAIYLGNEKKNQYFQLTSFKLLLYSRKQFSFLILSYRNQFHFLCFHVFNNRCLWHQRKCYEVNKIYNFLIFTGQTNQSQFSHTMNPTCFCFKI